MGEGTSTLSGGISQAPVISQVPKDHSNSLLACTESRCLASDIAGASSRRRGLFPGSLSATETEAMTSLNAVPSLSSDAASASASASSSSLSLDTGLASAIAGHEILQDDGNGVLVVPSHPTQRQQRIYRCLFHVLDCHEAFDDAEQWRTHIGSHFRTHEPPSAARCPLCPGERFGDTPQRRAWDLMLDHVDEAHYRQGHTLAGSRPDFELMQYLYRLRIITDDQFKVIQLPPPPSSPAYHRSQEAVRANIGSSDEPYCAPYSRRREQRMRGQRRGVGVA